MTALTRSLVVIVVLHAAFAAHAQDEESEAPLRIEILGDDGRLVRHYSSEEGDFDRCRVANMDPRYPFELEFPTTDKGLNKWVWDLRRDGVHCIEDVKIFAGFGATELADRVGEALPAGS